MVVQSPFVVEDFHFFGYYYLALILLYQLIPTFVVHGVSDLFWNFFGLLKQEMLGSSLASPLATLGPANCFRHSAVRNRANNPLVVFS